MALFRVKKIVEFSKEGAAGPYKILVTKALESFLKERADGAKDSDKVSDMFIQTFKPFLSAKQLSEGLTYKEASEVLVCNYSNIGISIVNREVSKGFVDFIQAEFSALVEERDSIKAKLDAITGCNGGEEEEGVVDNACLAGAAQEGLVANGAFLEGA